MGYLGNGLTITGTQNSKRIVVDATPNQTISTVTGGYLTGQLDVYRNGVKLVDTQDYTASDGASVTFLNAVSEGDELEFVVFENFDVANALSKSGGSLNGDLVVTGIATFNSDVSIGGTLTYEDVTNIDSVGIITARSFVSIADSIVHTGDEHTSIRFPAADTFTVETAGHERLRINSDGLVAVGGSETVSAATGIQIENAGAALLTLLRNDLTISDGNTLGGIDFYGNDGGTVQQVAKISAVADGTHGDSDKPTALVFQTTNDGAGSATEKLRITNSGRIGIGTDNPAGNLEIDAASTTDMIMLDVAGTNFAKIGHNSASGTDILDVRSEGHTRFLTNGNNERLRITSAGNVGIGTAAPTDPANSANTSVLSVGIVTARQYFGDGSNLSGISVGLTTEAVAISTAIGTIDMTAAQDHRVTCTGICTINATNGTEADSHTIRIVNSGIATVGFSTYFLFPSGAAPDLPTADGAISLISFTVHRVGTAGTQLLAGASLNFS